LVALVVAMLAPLMLSEPRGMPPVAALAGRDVPFRPKLPPLMLPNSNVSVAPRPPPTTLVMLVWPGVFRLCAWASCLTSIL
jgi:hypothetical protein